MGGQQQGEQPGEPLGAAGLCGCGALILCQERGRALRMRAAVWRALHRVARAHLLQRPCMLHLVQAPQRGHHHQG